MCGMPLKRPHGWVVLSCGIYCYCFGIEEEADDDESWRMAIRNEDVSIVAAAAAAATNDGCFVVMIDNGA